MAFQKKFTRRITVDDEPYLWYFRDNSLELDFGRRRRRIAIQHAVTPGQLLVADPFDGLCSIGINVGLQPRTVREIILFGLAHGWTPTEKATPIFIDHDGANWGLSKIDWRSSETKNAASGA